VDEVVEMFAKYGEQGERKEIGEAKGT